MTQLLGRALSRIKWLSTRLRFRSPLVARKALLAALLDPAPPNVLYARHIDATTANAPVTWLYEHALGLKFEGVVGKLAQSRYRPGVRATDWFKLKRPGAVPPERFHRKK